MRLGKLRTHRWAGMQHQHWEIAWEHRQLVELRWAGPLGCQLIITLRDAHP